jgi:hypothetical protein
VIIRTELVIDGIQFLPDELQPQGNGDEKLDMIVIQGIHVLSAVESPIHDQADLLIPDTLKIIEEMLQGLRIRNVSGYCPVVEGKTRVLTEHECQIDLR